MGPLARTQSSKQAWGLLLGIWGSAATVGSSTTGIWVTMLEHRFSFAFSCVPATGLRLHTSLPRETADRTTSRRPLGGIAHGQDKPRTRQGSPRPRKQSRRHDGHVPRHGRRRRAGERSVVPSDGKRTRCGGANFGMRRRVGGVRPRPPPSPRVVVVPAAASGQTNGCGCAHPPSPRALSLATSTGGQVRSEWRGGGAGVGQDRLRPMHGFSCHASGGFYNTVGRTSALWQDHPPPTAGSICCRAPSPASSGSAGGGGRVGRQVASATAAHRPCGPKQTTSQRL